MPKNGATRQRALELREQGMKYRDIAEQLGVSYQRVAQICGKSNPSRFRPVSDTCIYKNLKEWMNANKVSKREIIRRMGFAYHVTTEHQISSMLLGKYQPRKDYIDRLLLVTGMTYEELFATE